MNIECFLYVPASSLFAGRSLCGWIMYLEWSIVKGVVEEFW